MKTATNWGVEFENMEEDEIRLVILSSAGDDRLTWDAKDPEQVKEAMTAFDEKMTEGHLAFLIDDEGEIMEQINKTDWERMDVRQREEIVFNKPAKPPVKAPKKQHKGTIMRPATVGG